MTEERAKRAALLLATAWRFVMSVVHFVPEKDDPKNTLFQKQR